MTRDDIMNLQAGPEADALMAVEVMELPLVELTVDTNCPYCGNKMRYCGARSWCYECHEWKYTPYKQYTDDIAAAFEAVKKMRDKCHSITIIQFKKSYQCNIDITSKADSWAAPDASGEDKSECMAICKALLMAAMKLTETK